MVVCKVDKVWRMVLLILLTYVRTQLLFTNVFYFWKMQRIAKKESPIQTRFVVLFHALVWMDNFSCLCFLFMHVVNFMFWICILWNWNSQWLGIIILRSPEKGASWKFWLDPRFPQNPKLKWILKWVPLNRGYFKLYFLQKRKVF